MNPLKSLIRKINTQYANFENELFYQIIIVVNFKYLKRSSNPPSLFLLTKRHVDRNTIKLNQIQMTVV